MYQLGERQQERTICVSLPHSDYVVFSSINQDHSLTQLSGSNTSLRYFAVKNKKDKQPRKVEEEQEEQKQEEHYEEFKHDETYDEQNSANFSTRRKIFFAFGKAIKYSIWSYCVLFAYHFYLVRKTEKPEEAIG